MRRPVNRITVSIAASCLLGSLMMAGCGGGGNDDDGGEEPTPVSGMLRKVRSAAELEGSLKSSLMGVPAAGAPALPGFSATAADAAFSNTYTSEAGVDEFDYVRYDGTHLYIAPTAIGSQSARSIRILRTDPASGTATQVSSIPVDSDQQVQGIYVANGRLVMLTSEAHFRPYGDVWIMISIWAPTKLAIHVYDVSNPANPTRLQHAAIDGVFVASRRIGDRVYLVSRHTPTLVAEPLFHLRLANTSLDDLLPKVTAAGRTQPLVAPADCYITNEPQDSGYPILTTITSFSMASPAQLTSTCYNEEANGVYASTSALYIAQPRYDSSTSTSASQGSSTRIHKFSFTGAAPAYAGSVEVPGLLWLGGQGDFRMNEHQGLLRVMTTEQTSDPRDREDHRLFVLRPKSGELALEVMSSLPNAARPEELGKPDESLYGVRFASDRAYAVTFRRMDPFYVLDLSNPADPRIAGELQLPGFSEFLHPVTRDLLLGLGSDAGDIKLELFDVSVLASPQSRGRLVVEGPGAHTEAMYDRHAFAYLPADTMDRVAIPTTRAIATPAGVYNPQTSLHQFEVVGKQSAAGASLQDAGVVRPPDTQLSSGDMPSSRSFIHGDTVYFVRNGEVWSTSWFAPSQVQGPF